MFNVKSILSVAILCSAICGPVLEGMDLDEVCKIKGKNPSNTNGWYIKYCTLFKTNYGKEEKKNQLKTYELIQIKKMIRQVKINFQESKLEYHQKNKLYYGNISNEKFILHILPIPKKILIDNTAVINLQFPLRIKIKKQERDLTLVTWLYKKNSNNLHFTKLCIPFFHYFVKPNKKLPKENDILTIAMPVLETVLQYTYNDTDEKDLLELVNTFKKKPVYSSTDTNRLLKQKIIAITNDKTTHGSNGFNFDEIDMD